MEPTEIKKMLYKQKPMAMLYKINKTGLLYGCYVADETGMITKEVKFLIPINEIGDAEFSVHVKAALLIRWMIL